jgi:myo-inositol-1(or 4)-monophosphatase
MKPIDAQQSASLALQIARQAGDLALLGYRQPKTIHHKGAVDLVTNFDTDVEQFIREQLARATPDIDVVAEEQGGDRSGERTWYVDPIDGTTNYAHGHPFWCVSIALVVREAVVAGAVVAPSLALQWQAWEGGTALRNGSACAVSPQSDLQESLLATGFPYDRRTSPDNNFAAFFELKKRTLGIRRCGSAAIDLCFVADGTYDGYWERKLHPWDIAAGSCIVRAAGGRVSSPDAAEAYLRTGHVVASNGLIHDQLLQEVRKVSGLAVRLDGDR